jgi:hypothetical protein
VPSDLEVLLSESEFLFSDAWQWTFIFPLHFLPELPVFMTLKHTFIQNYLILSLVTYIWICFCNVPNSCKFQNQSRVKYVIRGEDGFHYHFLCSNFDPS